MSSSSRKALLAQKVLYESLISANLMELEYMQEVGIEDVSLPNLYVTGRSFAAEHLAIVHQISGNKGK